MAVFLLLHITPLVIALLISRFVRINVLKFSVVYANIVVIKTALFMHFLHGDYTVWVTLGGLLALVGTVILAGLLGTKMGDSNYCALLSIFGLFPWYYSKDLSCLFIIFLALLLIGWTQWGIRQGFKAINKEKTTYARAMLSLTAEDKETFRRASYVFYAFPAICASLLATLLVVPFH